jgi:hypothetical protein
VIAGGGCDARAFGPVVDHAYDRDEETMKVPSSTDTAPMVQIDRLRHHVKGRLCDLVMICCQKFPLISFFPDLQGTFG